MEEKQNEALEKRLEKLEKQIQNQQNEIKNARKCMICLGIALALWQAAEVYSGHVEREAILTLAESNLRNRKLALNEAQSEVNQLKILEKIIEFLSRDSKFQHFIHKDPEFFDSIWKGFGETQDRKE